VVITRDLFSNLLIYYLDCQLLPPNVEATTSGFSQDSLPISLTTQVG